MESLCLRILLVHTIDCRLLDLVLQFPENVVPILQQILPSLDTFARIGQPFSPHLHHVLQIFLPLLLVDVIFTLLNYEVLNAFVTFQNLLEHDVVLILDRVNVLGQEFGDMFHAQISDKFAIVAKFFPVIISARIVQIYLTAEHIGVIYVISNFLKTAVRHLTLILLHDNFLDILREGAIFDGPMIF